MTNYDIVVQEYKDEKSIQYIAGLLELSESTVVAIIKHYIDSASEKAEEIKSNVEMHIIVEDNE